jgi:hypothetical protein
MLKIRFMLLSALLAVWLTPLIVAGQPSLHGSLSGSLGPGAYIVDGDCQVQAGNTLTIQPGTTLLFAGHYTLNVYGQLNAVGTEQDSILFVRRYPTEECKHGGIRFQSGSSSASSLAYCWIDFAKNITSPNYYGGGIYVQNANISITHCRISNCYATSGGGIYVTGAAVTLDGCIFFANTSGNGGGLYLYNAGNSVVQNCILAKNGSTST